MVFDQTGNNYRAPRPIKAVKEDGEVVVYDTIGKAAAGTHVDVKKIKWCIRHDESYKGYRFYDIEKEL